MNIKHADMSWHITTTPVQEAKWLFVVCFDLAGKRGACLYCGPSRELAVGEWYRCGGQELSIRRVDIQSGTVVADTAQGDSLDQVLHYELDDRENPFSTGPADKDENSPGPVF